MGRMSREQDAGYALTCLSVAADNDGKDAQPERGNGAGSELL